MADKRPALGRGLSALIPDSPAAAPAPAADRSLDVDSDLLRPNKFQPRGAMDEAKIEELARSIRANGIIQPIVVRRSSTATRSSPARDAGAPPSAPACSRSPSSFAISLRIDCSPSR
jgi:hypothetical protein